MPNNGQKNSKATSPSLKNLLYYLHGCQEESKKACEEKPSRGRGQANNQPSFKIKSKQGVGYL
jgi:hypothetical protein